MVIIVDDEDRENEGDVMIAAEKASPETINFMARYACGLICLSLTEEKARRLNLPLMVQEDDNTSPTTQPSPSPLRRNTVLLRASPPTTVQRRS